MSNIPADHKEEPIRWYALWVYRSLVSPIMSMCSCDGVSYYRPMRLVERYTTGGVTYEEEAVLPNLLFVRATGKYLSELKQNSKNRGVAYCYPGTNVPMPIDDRSMQIFMLVVKAGAHHMEAVDLPIDKGDKVRVTDGIFKGAEGYIRRIHGSKRFVVAIEGVAAVAVTHVPRQFLERIAPLVSMHSDTSVANQNIERNGL